MMAVTSEDERGTEINQTPWQKKTRAEWSERKQKNKHELPLKHWIHFLRSSLWPPTSNILCKTRDIGANRSNTAIMWRNCNLDSHMFISWVIAHDYYWIYVGHCNIFCYFTALSFKCFYSLEINFVHLESCLKDAWSQNSAPQQILVKENKNRKCIKKVPKIIKISCRIFNDYTANVEQALDSANGFCGLNLVEELGHKMFIYFPPLLLDLYRATWVKRLHKIYLWWLRKICQVKKWKQQCKEAMLLYFRSKMETENAPLDNTTHIYSQTWCALFNLSKCYKGCQTVIDSLLI